MENKSKHWKSFSVFIGVLLILLIVSIIEYCRTDLISKKVKSDVNVVQNVDLSVSSIGTTYPKRFQLLLPADVSRELGISLDSMKMMSEALYERYPNDTIEYYDYNRADIEDGNNVFFFTSNNGQELRVEDALDNVGNKYYIVDKIEYYIPTETRSVPAEAKSIYEYTPDQKNTFSEYVRSDGFDKAELTAVEELNCCYYIYFTVEEESRFIRVDKDTETITIRGTVSEGIAESEVRNENN